MDLHRKRQETLRYGSLHFARRSPFFLGVVLAHRLELILKFRAVQWSAWLTHTRSCPPSIEVRSVCVGVLFIIVNFSVSCNLPPAQLLFLPASLHSFVVMTTLQELQSDLARQRRVQMNAAILEARDKEERERTARLAQPLESHPRVPEPRSDEAPERRRGEPPVDARSDSVPTPVRDPWAEVKRGSDEPQSWTPVVRRK